MRRAYGGFTNLLVVDPLGFNHSGIRDELRLLAVLRDQQAVVALVVRADYRDIARAAFASEAAYSEHPDRFIEGIDGATFCK